MCSSSIHYATMLARGFASSAVGLSTICAFAATVSVSIGLLHCSPSRSAELTPRSNQPADTVIWTISSIMTFTIISCISMMAMIGTKEASARLMCAQVGITLSVAIVGFAVAVLESLHEDDCSRLLICFGLGSKILMASVVITLFITAVTTAVSFLCGAYVLAKATSEHRWELVHRQFHQSFASLEVRGFAGWMLSQRGCTSFLGLPVKPPQQDASTNTTDKESATDKDKAQ